MKKTVSILVTFFAVFLLSTSVQAEDYVYVVNSYVHAAAPEPDWSTVSKLTAGALGVVDTLTLPACNDAHSAALTPDRSRLWVTCPTTDSIEIIDTDSFEIVDTINILTPYLTVRPMGITMSPDGSKVYITYDGYIGGIGIRDAADGSFVDWLDFGGMQNFITLTPDGSKGYVVDYQHARVTVIEATLYKALKPLDFEGVALQDAVVSPDGSHVYVSNMDRHKIEVIRTSDDTALTAIETDYLRPRGINISPDGQYLFVGHYLGVDSLVTMLRLSDQTVVATAAIPSNPRRIVVNEAGTRIYVTEHNEDEVYFYDVSGETLTYAGSQSLNAVPGYNASPVGIVLSEAPFSWPLLRGIFRRYGER